MIPAAIRQEGMNSEGVYWRDCQREGEHLLALYRRAMVNRTFAEQRQALHDDLGDFHELAPNLRRLIAAVDQELLSLNRLEERDRQRYARLSHYRTGLVSLWDILLPYLSRVSSRVTPSFG